MRPGLTPTAKLQPCGVSDNDSHRSCRMEHCTPHQLKMALTARSNRSRQPARHPVMLSTASGLDVPSTTTLATATFVSRLYLACDFPTPSIAFPPDHLVRQEPFSHGLPGDAGMAHGRSRAVSGGERGQTPSSDLPAVPASRSMGMKRLPFLGLNFPCPRNGRKFASRTALSKRKHPQEDPLRAPSWGCVFLRPIWPVVHTVQAEALDLHRHVLLEDLVRTR